jgi:hypothetical protein
MPELQHVYLTAHGAFVSGHFTGETGQIGLRLAICEDGSAPAKGTTFDLPLSGNVAVDSGTSSGTHGTLTRTWTARLGTTGSTNNGDAAWQIDLAEDFWVFLDGLKTYMGPQWRWTHIKIAPILADGSYGAPAAVYQFTSAIVGGGSSNNAPEVALALTLRAPIIGRRGRGRMYLPALSTSSSVVGGDGTVASTVTTAILAAAATLIASLEDAPGVEQFGPIVTVMSAGNASGVRPSQIRVGNHFDVQRRRQRQIAETYTTTAL